MTRKAEKLYFELVARAKSAIATKPEDITIGQIRLHFHTSDNCLKHLVTMYVNHKQSDKIDEIIFNSILKLKKFKREVRSIF